MSKTDPKNLYGKSISALISDFDNEIAFNDHKIRFVTKYCSGKSVLDIGCVQHNPENYKSKYWLHKAIKQVASSVVGIDLYEEGVKYLKDRGWNIVVADAQAFDLKQTFDLIVAGDIIEHLEDFHGFLTCCRNHMNNDSKLLISTPNPWYWKKTLQVILGGKVITVNPEHTCWFDPTTLRQLVRRHGFDIGEIVFGSTYLRDRIKPLPKGLKHTSFHVEVFIP